MVFEKAQKQVRRNIQKKWLKTVFSKGEWEDWTGKAILEEARRLKYKICSSTFYKIRKEILEEYNITPNESDSFEQAHIDYVASLKEKK